jgi:hypothetical protein
VSFAARTPSFVIDSINLLLMYAYSCNHDVISETLCPTVKLTYRSGDEDCAKSYVFRDGLSVVYPYFILSTLGTNQRYATTLLYRGTGVNDLEALFLL